MQPAAGVVLSRCCLSLLLILYGVPKTCGRASASFFRIRSMYVLVRSSKRGTAQARAMHAAGTLAIPAPCQMPGTKRESFWLSREQLDGRTMRMALCIRYVSPVRSRAIGQQGGGQPCPFFLFILFYWILKTRSVWSYIDRGSRGPGLRAAWTERALGHGGCARCCRAGGLMDGVGLGGRGAGGVLAVTGLGHFLLCET